jgi:acetyl-CoA carboxylase biotin carboxyl carrier protein
MTSPLDHIAEVIAWFAATDIDHLELTGRDGHLRLRRSGEPAAPPEAPIAEAGEDAVASSGCGLFLHAHPLHETPLVRRGDRVVAGQVLGLLKVGALLLPVRAPHEGVVKAVIAPDGSLVGFGEPLIELSP